MSRMSLKIKLTILYTFFMVIVTCAALLILFSLSSREVLSSVQTKLENRVQKSVEDIDYKEGEFVIDNDFYSVFRDIYLSIYDENMYFMFGKIPHGFDENPGLSDGEMRRITDGGKDWYVYDMSFRIDASNTVYVRGITSVTDAEESFAVTVRFALILFPILVLATAIIGYRITRRALMPVRKMTQTVKEIREDADLSRRIGINGNEKEGDEIRILAETFDSMLDELEKVFEREKQFTSDVSHELRTPVSVILAQCGETLSCGNLAEKDRDAVLLIRRKAEETADLLAQILFFSRADQGRQPISKEWINLGEITEMAVEEQKLLLEASGKDIDIFYDPKPELYAEADETLFIRLIGNLLSNAVRYSRTGGRIDVILKKSGDEIVGEVRDNGIGIRKKDMPKIWERFYRADPSRSEEGSGLGLSMVKWIAETHGGWADAESVFGEGSSFRFGIPVKKK